jgi:hypothetical protein
LPGSASGIGRQIEVLAAGTDHDIDTALQALHKSGSMATGHEPAKAPKPSKLKFEQRSPARRERPRGSRTAEQGDEFATFHYPLSPLLPTERIAHLGATLPPSSWAERDERDLAAENFFPKEVAQK